MIKHKQNQTVKLWWGKILNSYKRFIDVQAIQRAPTTQRSQEANGTSRWFTEVSGKLIKVKKRFSLSLTISDIQNNELPFFTKKASKNFKLIISSVMQVKFWEEMYSRLLVAGFCILMHIPFSPTIMLLGVSPVDMDIYVCGTHMYKNVHCSIVVRMKKETV